MTPWIDSLDRLHARARQSPLLYRLVLATRILFAAGFIPTGMVKLLGLRFTLISPDEPIGAFFEAMYQTGLYWRFLGFTQVLAGLLMLVPRAATLGAVIFFPVIVNIFVITVALDFKGTPLVTGAMLFAAASLLAWDWDRLRFLLTRQPMASGVAALPRVEALGAWWERLAYGVGGAACLAFFFSTRLGLPSGWLVALVGLGLLAALVALVGWLRARRQPR